MKRKTAGRRTVANRWIQLLLDNKSILIAAVAAVIVLILLISSSSSKNKITELEEKAAALESSIVRLESANAQLESESEANAKAAEEALKNQGDIVRAMDLFWQIDESYVLGRTSRARELIRSIESQGLAPCLPTASTTDNGRFSPYDRYAEICEALGESYGAGVHS